MVKGSKQTEESKRKISEAKKGNKNLLGFKFSEESKRERSENMKKIWKDPNSIFNSEETKRKIRETMKDRIKNGGGNAYWHNKAWELFGKDYCEECYITLQEHKESFDRRLEMHNTLDPKDYTVMESDAWMCLCRKCHLSLEAILNNKINI